LYGAGTADNYLAGKLLIGTTTVGTQALQVNGDTFLKGSGNTSATTALLVENSSGTGMFTILNNGYTRYGNASTSAFRVYPGSVSGAGDVDLSGEFLVLNSRSSTTETGGSFGFVTINGVNVLGTSGIYNLVSISRTFAPTSGTAVFNMLNFVPVINQTGGANGITRGLYINPILTAAADWRSIELSNNTGWGLYGAGTANNYLAGNLLLGTTTDTGYRLNVNGAIYGKGITADSDGGVGNAIYAYNQVLSGSSNNALVQLSTTWNTTGNAVGIEFNVFNTASGASSRLIDLKVDLVSKFIVYKDGKINASSLPTSATGLGTGDIWNNGGVLNIV
jgi:hypothetical protein